ncbi:type IV toxin-antitoxin system YeeU family antitoxin [Escherichia coli]|nr:type IV toxin-antitoxin system YeeU family antitoxin [Salmonella enterica subsp. enterica serovar Meleagridis]ECU4718708.1 type IV toxin-antitoxin system YeeU family antitoxin [Salmonella enterica subsp. enterica]EEW7327774.1 type IV toxin-antitoxin system YeeU family antitoxin [Escherichia coli]QCH69319.1 type IV toxin-antitoxin system YeeU family antitoxin [Escherichia coli O103:H2]EFO0404469.1 type IV toxin-antitoxin system YeeU family antitoxin [Escherichia coli]
MRSCSSTNTPLPKPVCAPADPSSLNYHSPIFCEDFIVSDTLSGTTHPDDNDDHPWWGLPCTVTPCFGARLVQEGNRLHYLADRAGIRGRFSDADAYHLDQAFPLLMKQLELMLTSGELNPRHQHTVTLYAKGLTCKADTLGSGGYVYLAVYPTPETKK